MITVNGVTDRNYGSYADQVVFTVVAEAGFTTTATLNGQPVATGAPVTVVGVQYYELFVTKTPSAGGAAETRLIQFIIHATERGNTENGLPPWTPYRLVNDAPSAFAGGVLEMIAPAAWPKDLPIPVAARLRDHAGEGLRLNGVVRTTSFPASPIQLRRGFGSRVLPAVATAGVVQLDARVNGAAHTLPIVIEASPTFATVSGTLAGNVAWPANSRMHVTNTLTIPAGATLTIGAGAIVKIAPGVELVADGTLQVNGTPENPVIFTPEATATPWGGIEMTVATGRVFANGAIFTGSGADPTWFDTHSGYSSHRGEQALFLIGAAGAELHCTDCWMFDLAGQAMNSKNGTTIELRRTLIQRCITSGELNDSTVTIDRGAIIEIPSDDAAFVDGDNDGLYLTGGTHNVTRTVIGWTKDDGIDSGGNGGTGTVTNYAGNWYESTFHEGNSLSGLRAVTFTGCVFTNCGQGAEAGYTNAATGPDTLVDGCLFVGNLVGLRRGDNYDWTYNSRVEAKNSLLVGNFYHDVWGLDWNPSSWIYADATELNVHDSRLSHPDPLHHPNNATWNPASDGNLLAPFMPVPGSNVGIAILGGAAQAGTATYPGEFEVRLSTFSSRAVSASYAVIGKSSPSGEDIALGSGALVFAPGETVKTISAPVAAPEDYGIIRVTLSGPNATEITGGDAWFFKSPPTPEPNLVARGAGNWRYRETRSEPPAGWKTLAFDDSSSAATEWLPATLPAGFGASGVVTTVASGSASDRTRAFYFRKKFTVPNLAAVRGLTFRIRRDDAAVVWLNNETAPTLVSADGTFNGPYTYAMTGTAGAVPSAANPNAYLTSTIPPAKLVAGENILAVEVHQQSLTSGDLVFDCELLAIYPSPSGLSLARVGGQPVLYWFDSTATLETGTDLMEWTPLPAATSPLPFSTDEAQRFFRLRAGPFAAPSGLSPKRPRAGR